MQNNRQGTVVPQTLRPPDSPVARRQNVERALLQLPLFFVNRNGGIGIRLKLTIGFLPTCLVYSAANVSQPCEFSDSKLEMCYFARTRRAVQGTVPDGSMRYIRITTSTTLRGIVMGKRMQTRTISVPLKNKRFKLMEDYVLSLKSHIIHRFSHRRTRQLPETRRQHWKTTPQYRKKEGSSPSMLFVHKFAAFALFSLTRSGWGLEMALAARRCP